MTEASYERVLFLGGAADGQVRNVHSGVKTLALSIHPPFHSMDVGDAAQPTAYARDFYWRAKLTTPFKDYSVFAQAGLSMEKVIELLIKNYHPEKGGDD